MPIRPNPTKRVRHEQPDTLVYTIEDRLYVNLTDRCTLACHFCPKHNGSKELHDYNLTLSERPEQDHIIEQIGDPSRYEEIVFCGFGEPTLRLKALVSVATAVKAKGGRTRLNTDGLANLFHKKNVVPLLASCIDAMSISLNAQDEQTYTQHCAPSLANSHAEALSFIKLAADMIPDVTATAIDGLEGVDILACQKLAQERGAKFKARALDVVG